MTNYQDKYKVPQLQLKMLSKHSRHSSDGSIHCYETTAIISIHRRVECNQQPQHNSTFIQCNGLKLLNTCIF